MLIREIENKIDSINNLEVVHGRTKQSKQIIDSLKKEIENIKKGEQRKTVSLEQFLASQEKIEPHKMSDKEYDSLISFFR